MSNEPRILSVLRSVLTLRNGEGHAIRELHLPAGTIHRYRDGWHYLIDLHDRLGCPRAVLGWSIRTEEDVVDFLTGAIDRHHLNNLALVGERL